MERTTGTVAVWRGIWWVVVLASAWGSVGCGARTTPDRAEDGVLVMDVAPAWAGRSIDAERVRAFGWQERAGGFEIESEVIRPRVEFGGVLASANIDVPTGGGFVLEIRVGKESWRSPWLRVMSWGDRPPTTDAVHSFDDAAAGMRGVISVDSFSSPCRFDAVQYRVVASSESVRVRRVCLRLLPSDAWVWRRPGWRPARAMTLDVPFRSQRTPVPGLAGRLCSPTSVAMVLAYRGVDASVYDVAQRAYDPENEPYGNWPRNVQAAWTFGVPGYVTTFQDWPQVERHLAANEPIVASIVAGPGELRGAPYPKTDGHLIVLRGFDEHGNLLVSDSSVGDPARGMLVYQRDDLTNVWMQRTGGAAYVLLDPRGPAAKGAPR